jgi:aconitate hydratase
VGEIDSDTDPLGVRDAFDSSYGAVDYYSLQKLKDRGFGNISRLPFSMKVLLESVLRKVDGELVTEEDVRSVARWSPDRGSDREIPFIPSRVLLQDFTGVPAIVDLAAMRSALHRERGDPSCINPLIPVDLVIDHSVQVDNFGDPQALMMNERREYERNGERYALLRWAQKGFDNIRVVPPGKGIVHQVNLEHLSSVVHLSENVKGREAYSDTLVGTDSHTTMVNGLGVLGWGVGGIEAEAVMLGQPYHMPVPDVVGVRLEGRLRNRVTATDLVLTLTRMLREKGVVGKFVEFTGPGLDNLSLPDRATISNMAPEYGATVGFFPVDDETLRYLLLTGKAKEHLELVRLYSVEQGLFRSKESPEPAFSETLELDMGRVKSTISGPTRPQDTIALGDLSHSFHQTMVSQIQDEDLPESESEEECVRWMEDGGDHVDGHASELEHVESVEEVSDGSVVIAAITSCTNTSNPSVMIGAGLLAKNAVERGLNVKPWVKTSLAPGSRVVPGYLKECDVLPHLESLGFYVVGYGCTTCIGNSGPLPEEVAQKVVDGNLTVAAILSGNRNFEGRINPLVKANYLASPILVVAYALAGTVDIDLGKEPLGIGSDGSPVFLRDIWPRKEDVDEIVRTCLTSDLYVKQYSDVFEGTDLWDGLTIPEGKLYSWNPESGYIREPPFFEDLSPESCAVYDIHGARVLALLEDSITTDHISPAGAIPAEECAGQYLVSKGVDPADFNSFGSRRGNHEVMIRGTFSNIRLRNKLTPSKVGGWTIYHPTGEEMDIYDAAMRYRETGVPLIVIAGKEYGTGSSRDWAAKGTKLLGVKAVIAQSYERIHRSNLVGMGVLPLEFKDGDSAETLGLDGKEVYNIEGIETIEPKGELKVAATGDDGGRKEFMVKAKLNSSIELEYYQNGGILHKFIRELMVQEG